MHIKSNRQAFTLIEILLTMSLIALALSMMGFPIAKALKKERFERGVDQVIARITLAQELMLDTGQDVVLTFFHEDGLNSTISVQTPLPERLEKGFNHHARISGITELELDTALGENAVIYFDATVGMTSKGTLRLSNGLLEETIVLKGYPTRIRRGKKDAPTIQEAAYPQEILSAV